MDNFLKRDIIEILSNFWAGSIILELANGARRFTELRASIGITDQTLTTKLQFLTGRGFIRRESFAEVPPRVEYTLTDIGRKLLPIFESLRQIDEEFFNFETNDFEQGEICRGLYSGDFDFDQGNFDPDIGTKFIEPTTKAINPALEEDSRKVLREYKDNDLTEAETLAKLQNILVNKVEDLGFANIDHARELRQGFPEVVYAAGKTKQQLRSIFKSLYEHSNGNLIATRASREQYEFLIDAVPDAKYDEIARMIYVDRKDIKRRMDKRILIVSAGTSDLPVCEEARLTAYLWGNVVETVYDCGVAGIHRLFAHMNEIKSANVIVVVAGMEGALASVIGGLTDKPVIAVPTSVGYGASFNGLAALLSMLNSCASGVSVVNIDNGFGAGVLASKINRLSGG